MEIIFSNYDLKGKPLDFTIKNNEFNGIYTDNNEEVLELLNLKNNYKGKIYVDGKEIQKEEINKYKRKIGIVKERIDRIYYQNKVFELMYYEIKRKGLKLKNPKKKIIDALKIVGLDVEYLNRNINTLSTSERKLFLLSLTLLQNPEIIILEEPFKEFDKKETKRVYMFLQKIKEKYNKTIIIISNDTNILYKYTNHLVIIKNDKLLIEGNTSSIITRVDYLTKNNIESPEIVMITYLAKKNKNIKIDYHKDIRDIIKDIYKHV